MSARRISAKKQTSAHTRVEFATTNMTPDDLLYFSKEYGQPKSRKPHYIGIIVWVPFDTYEQGTKGG